MTERRGRHPEQTRDALLDAAESLFANRGFDGTRTDEIARVSGVNKAMINYYFGGKRGLYRAMLERNLSPALARMEELTRSTASAAERLDGFIRIFGDLHLNRPNLSLIVFREAISGDGRNLDEGPLPSFLKAFGTLRQILEQGQREGTLRSVPVPQAHITLLGGLVFFFATRRFRARVAAEGNLPFLDISPADFVEFYRELMGRAFAPVAGGEKPTGGDAAAKSSSVEPARANADAAATPTGKTGNKQTKAATRAGKPMANPRQAATRTGTANARLRKAATGKAATTPRKAATRAAKTVAKPSTKKGGS